MALPSAFWLGPHMFRVRVSVYMQQRALDMADHPQNTEAADGARFSQRSGCVCVRSVFFWAHVVREWIDVHPGSG